MLKKQSHTCKADIYCFGRLGEFDSVLTYSIHHDGNGKWETLIGSLNCIALITHKPSNRQFSVPVLEDGFREGDKGK